MSSILEECSGCDLVKYCGDRCQENHREQHKEECKKRKAELRDKELFEQPEMTCYGECPICVLPIPLDQSKSLFHSCCCKLVCEGCCYADYISSGRMRCPFCREPAASGEEEHRKRTMKRVKANDPAALNQMGGKSYVAGDYDKAVEYFTKAAELGDSMAHHSLGCMYSQGIGVEKDEEMAIRHWEKAAIGGNHQARYNLYIHETDMKRAVKHLFIAAKLGDEGSIKKFLEYYPDGIISKTELDATLRAHQSAIDATKSAQRDAAEACHQRKATASR